MVQEKTRFFQFFSLFENWSNFQPVLFFSIFKKIEKKRTIKKKQKEKKKNTVLKPTLVDLL